MLAAPYAFFDAGYVANNNAAATGQFKSRTLKSIGAGVVFRVFSRANLEVTYAHPLDAVRPGGSTWRSCADPAHGKSAMMREGSTYD